MPATFHLGAFAHGSGIREVRRDLESSTMIVLTPHGPMRHFCRLELRVSVFDLGLVQGKNFNDVKCGFHGGIVAMRMN